MSDDSESRAREAVRQILAALEGLDTREVRAAIGTATAIVAFDTEYPALEFTTIQRGNHDIFNGILRSATETGKKPRELLN